jgi:juvenile hormone epoxide hydrolase
MGCCSLKKLFWLSTLILALSIGVSIYFNYKSDLALKEIAEWAENNKIVIDKNQIELTKFKIEYDENEWQLLLSKLKATRYFDHLNEPNVPRHEFGFDVEYSKELVKYWSTKFDWQKQVNNLNRHSQFKLYFKKDDITIHFMRYTNKKHAENYTPLLMMDGWPGSFSSFQSMLDYIEKKYPDTPLDIIVPSIPGYGYSTPLSKIVDTVDTARYFDALMRYIHGDSVKYFIHGEDWGSVITQTMAKLYPQRISGIHITMLIADLTSPNFLFYGFLGDINQNLVMTQQELDDNRSFRLSDFLKRTIKHTGYLHIQATKPVILLLK